MAASQLKIKDLEDQLQEEKTRFMEASKAAANAVKIDLNVKNWFQEYPVESALAIIFIGFGAGMLLQKRRRAAAAADQVVQPESHRVRPLDLSGQV